MSGLRLAVYQAQPRVRGGRVLRDGQQFAGHVQGGGAVVAGEGERSVLDAHKVGGLDVDCHDAPPVNSRSPDSR